MPRVRNVRNDLRGSTGPARSARPDAQPSLDARARRACVRALAAASWALAWPLARANEPAGERPTAAATAPREVRAELPEARLLGAGRLQFLGLRVYDARLWAPPRFAAERFGEQPFALELAYHRRLVGRLIAERSLSEMQRVGEFSDEQGARWLAWMQRHLPDVTAGDRITGVHRDGVARFFFNGAALAELRDAEFARLFFGIWLSPRTSEPALRRSLIGAS